MKENFKRLTGFLLVVFMTLTMLPFFAIAEDSAVVPDDASFVVDGNTFWYLNESVNYNGKKYFKIFDKRDWVPWNGDAYYMISPRDEGGLYLAINHASATGTDLQNHTTNLGVFGDYKISSDYEWNYGNVMYDGATTPAYLKGSISLPSQADYSFVIGKGLNFNYQGAKRLTSSFFPYNNKTHRYVYNGNTSANDSVEYVADGDYFKGKSQARYNYVTYISEEFFKKTHLDIATMSTDVRNMMSENFDAYDLASAGYTDEELELLGIALPTTPEGSSFMVGERQFVLMDSTKNINNKTYYGVLSTEPLNTNWNKNVMHLNYLTDSVYGSTGDILVELQVRNFDTDVRTDIQTFVTKFDEFGTYIAPPTTEWIMSTSANAKLYHTGSISLPTGAELIALDAVYPLSYAKNNNGILYRNISNWENNFYHISPLKREGETLNVNGSNAHVNSDNDSISSHNASGTWYLMTYVSEDFFLENKLDLGTMSANVRKMLADNYYHRDFAPGVYTIEELYAIGIAERPTDGSYGPDWSPDYVKLENDLELLYLGDDSHGKALFMIAKDYAGTDTVEGLYTKADNQSPSGDTLDPSVYMEYYLMGSEEASSTDTTLDEAVLEDIPEAMKKYLSDAERNAGLIYRLDESKSGTAKTRAIFTAPSEAEIIKVIDYVKSLILDNTNKNNSHPQSYSTKCAVIRDVSAYAQRVYDVEAGQIAAVTAGLGFSSGSALPVFAVDKDFIKAVKVDIKTLGVNIKPFFEGLAKGDFTADYTDEEFDALGITAYNEQIKPQPGTSTAFSIDGEKYLLSGKFIKENGTKYFLVMNSAHLATNQGPYGRITESILNTDSSTIGTKYFGDFKVGANWGTLEKNGTKYEDGTLMSSLQDVYFPSETFGNNLKLHDWNMSNSWVWSDGVMVDIYHRAYMSMPSLTEVKEFDKNDELSTQYSSYVETRSFTDAYDWKRMLVANINDGEDAGSSVVGADNFAFRANQQGKFFFVAYISEKFFKTTNINLATAGDGFKKIIRDNFERSDLTGWTEENLDLLFGGYNGEGLGLEAYKVSNGVNVIVHNNSSQPAGKGSTIIVVAYDDEGMVGYETFPLEENVSAGAKTSALNVPVDLSDATDVRVMLWKDIFSVESLADAVTAR